MTLEKLYTDLKEAFTGKTVEVEAKAGEIASLNAKVAEMTAAISSKEAAFVELAAQAKDMADKLASAEAFAKKAQEDVARRKPQARKPQPSSLTLASSLWKSPPVKPPPPPSRTTRSSPNGLR